jgi:phage terminase large subunit GpA-like protein
MTPGLHHLAGKISEACLPDPIVKISEWAEECRVLPADSPEPGEWRNSRTPYLVDIMDTMSTGSGFREGWVKKGVQLGGSAAGENFIGSSICNAAGSILVVFPTLEDAKQWELQRFEPMRKNSKELRRRVLGSDVKGADNTKLRKKYPGGVMRLVGANRVGALKSSTIRYVKFEEPDEYPPMLGRQGSVIGLARNRPKNFGMRARIYGDGTPTVVGASAIDENYRRGDQRKRYMLCPDCDHPQPFEWEQFTCVDQDPATTRYRCRECGALGTEAQWKSGRNMRRPNGWTEPECKAAGLAYWEPTAKGEKAVASWHLPSFYAPLGWRPWVELMAAWIEAQGDPIKLQEFWNNERAEPYEDKLSGLIDADALQKRAEDYPLMQCPQDALMVVAGVDTQDNRLAVVIRGFGRGEESWGLYHGEIFGDPSDPAVWAQLRKLLEEPIPHASGQRLHVDVAFIDAGGHHTEDVYAFCREAQLAGRHWVAIRGAKDYNAPKVSRPKTMEFTYDGQPVPGGATIRFVGTQAIKNVIDGRFRIQQGAGRYHFPKAFERDYFDQVRAEKRVRRTDKSGGAALWWVGTGARNEYWDCEVYAYAAFLYAMSGRDATVFWRDREMLLAPTTRDMFDPVHTSAQPAAPDPMPEPPPVLPTHEEITPPVLLPAPVQRAAEPPARAAPASVPHYVRRRSAVPTFTRDW